MGIGFRKRQLKNTRAGCYAICSRQYFFGDAIVERFGCSISFDGKHFRIRAATGIYRNHKGVERNSNMY